MPGEGLNNQNQGTETNNAANEAFNAWEQMANDVKQEQQENVETLSAEVVDANGRVLTATKAEMRPYEVEDMGAVAGVTGAAEQAAAFNADAYRAAVESAEAAMPKVETETVTDAWADLAGEQSVNAGVSEVADAEKAVEQVTEQKAEQVEAKVAGREKLDAWLESVKGTPEEYWQRLTEEKREKGVELGTMPDLTKVNKAIQNFFENGLVGVTGKAREVREEMAKKAILNDIAKLKERGGELTDEVMQNVFLGAQRMLEEMYRGNLELREDAQDEELSPDEEIAWHLKMDPRKANMNTRRPEETSDAYEARLRNYAEDTLEHQEQLKRDQEYNAEHPDEAMEYAAQVLKNGQKDDLPEFTYLKWDEASEDGAKAEMAQETEQPVEREGRIKRLFERVREKLGFRKVVDKVMTKVAGAVMSATAWAEGGLAEDGENETASAGQAQGAEAVQGKVEAREASREELLRKLNDARAEAARRMAKSQGDNAAILRLTGLIVKLNAKIAEVEAGSETAPEALVA